MKIYGFWIWISFRFQNCWKIQTFERTTKTKNKAAYEILNENKLKYRYRLNYELEKQKKDYEN